MLFLLSFNYNFLVQMWFKLKPLCHLDCSVSGIQEKIFYITEMSQVELLGTDQSPLLFPFVSSQDFSCRHRSSHVEVKGFGFFNHPHPAAACCHGRHFHWTHVSVRHRLWTCCVSQHWHHLHNWSDALPQPVVLLTSQYSNYSKILMYLSLKDLKNLIYNDVFIYVLL